MYEFDIVFIINWHAFNVSCDSYYEYCIIIYHFVQQVYDDTVKCVGFQMEGIIYEASTLCDGLVKATSSQIGVDTTVDELEIKYIMNERFPPIHIHNDVGVRVYLDQSKVNIDFSSNIHCA